jgi:hypothetical protein
LNPPEVTGTLTLAASDSRQAHVWAAVDTIVWRAGVIPGLIYFRQKVIYLILVSVALNLAAHWAARRAARRGL